MRIQSIQSLTFLGKPEKYAEVNKSLSRSAQPLPEDLPWLKEQGVTDIINLRTMTDKSILFDEGAESEKLGMKYHNVAIYHRNPTEKNLTDFLEIMDDVEKKGGKAHIHCLEGKDRTGLCAFVYKGLRGIGTLAQNEAEWLSFGHDFVRYPNLRGWAKEFLQKIKP